MELTQEQLNAFSRYILTCDIQSYINNHLKEYHKFLEQLKNKK